VENLQKLVDKNLLTWDFQKEADIYRDVSSSQSGKHGQKHIRDYDDSSLELNDSLCDTEELKILLDDVKWNEMYNYFVQYGEVHGNCNVPANYVLPTEIKLGKWLSEQRRNYKAGSLTQDRRGLLQVLVDENKLLWDATKLRKIPDDVKWAEFYDKLVSYGEAHEGNCNISKIEVQILYLMPISNLATC